MANYRTSKLFAKKAYSGDASELIDINVVDPISRILIGFEGTNTSGTGTTGHPAKGVKTIELVDGSDVLFSLNGMELYGAQFIHDKVVPPDYNVFWNDNVFHMTFRMNFGRWLWDPDFALDPKRFNNLQLKIETDQDAGGCAPDASALYVTASLFDQKSVSPMGFLQTKKVKTYTMAASSHEYTDLPTDLKIRKLMVKALLEGTEFSQVLSNIKLTEDHDKRIIIDEGIPDIIRLYPDENQLYTERVYCGLSAAGLLIHHTPTERCGVSANDYYNANDGYATVYGGNGGRVKIYGSTFGNACYQVSGFCPNAMVSIPLGDEWDPSDWLDPTGLKNLRLDILTTATGTTPYTCEILAEQLRTY